MSLEGRAIVIRQDDVDTDVLYPGTYLNVTDVQQMTQYLFEGLDPSLRDQLGGDTALVVGSNFGTGSSREHVPQAMAASGLTELAQPTLAAGETVADLLADRTAFEEFDADKVGERSYGFVHLNQLALEHALGGR